MALRYKAGKYFLQILFSVFVFVFLFRLSVLLSVTVFPTDRSSPLLAGYPQCFSRDSKFLMFLSNREWKELAEA